MKNKDKFGDVLKKISTVIEGGAFLSEEAIKALLGDTSLPKSIVGQLLENARTVKKDLSNSLREEFRRYLSKVEVDKMADHLAKHYDLEVKANFSLKKKAPKKSKSPKAKED